LNELEQIQGIEEDFHQLTFASIAAFACCCQEPQRQKPVRRGLEAEPACFHAGI
jgi:hypothetical protein